MDTSASYSQTVSQNITIPAGHSMIQYVGFLVTEVNMSRKRCSSNGQAISTTWSGRLTGPRLRSFGWIDCLNTSLC
jgi:hypothetical protein